VISKKVILTGSFGVGKTSLFNRFINNKFDEKYMTTIGVKVNKKSVFIEEQEVALLLWDIAGEISQEKVPTSYFLGAAGVIYVFDLSRPMTFQNIAADLEYLRNLLPYSVVRIVGNKSDLLSAEQLEEVAQKLSVKWDIVTSAKNGDNVEELFIGLASEMV
jgi:small GTP-binding protein